MKEILIVGGGAAGYFAAISAATAFKASGREARITILEGSSSPLGKVRISGGGRCNVTHDCPDASDLVTFYPRGEKELLGPFYHFGAMNTVAWFEAEGVALKTEQDGRMFPVSDSSQTIIDALLAAANRLGVRQLLNQRVGTIEPTDQEPGTSASRWRVSTAGQSVFEGDAVIVCSGSSPHIWRSLAALGLDIVPAVPSLFAFDTRDTRLRDLAGVSVQDAHVQIEIAGARSNTEASGPLLITHRGVSGPAILRLSAWGATALAACEYQFGLRINWLGNCTAAECLAGINDARPALAKKKVIGHSPFSLPTRLFASLAEHAGIDQDQRWADLGREEARRLADILTNSVLRINGKSTNKDEFVTAGGVARSEIDFRNFAARRFPGLFLAGEVIDIDALTGGFNFQAAWTGGYLAGNGLAEAL
ncbi:MAG: aminoacetone oxidase family FAD-binding enzyme [unclassified Hahellaceae]|nr:aminoacetone oxidase family FAD-binding enzyme [Hahellaceae bacterium]|tara:strand:- start:9483 stop:10745 length:1263 start_codon:yes stop_codon:yes gene_type:complete